ncbi:late histone H2A.2.2-like [Protopterus annectens]|uniref:late histone H2A.2.2-like n=1 Tax=Protopterus annectens TaxID=7888 RepID=UPI001CF957FC|nr:late histone H2A.2.2-like [Protopterus annectens]
MSGRSNVQKVRAAPKSKSVKAGLTFPVGRVHRLLKHGKYARKIGCGASVYLAAVLEYMTAEVMELAGSVAHNCKRNRITPRHIQLAVRNDDEFHKLLEDVTIAEGGVLPNIHAQLLGKRTNASKGELSQSQEM